MPCCNGGLRQCPPCQTVREEAEERRRGCGGDRRGGASADHALRRAKSADQQARAVAFRSREQLVKQRTETVNALRSHLYEFRHIAPEGIGYVARLARVVDDPETDIPDLARDICRMLIEQIAHLTDRINASKIRIAAMSRRG